MEIATKRRRRKTAGAPASHKIKIPPRFIAPEPQGAKKSREKKVRAQIFTRRKAHCAHPPSREPRNRQCEAKKTTPPQGSQAPEKIAARLSLKRKNNSRKTPRPISRAKKKQPARLPQNPARKLPAKTRTQVFRKKKSLCAPLAQRRAKYDNKTRPPIQTPEAPADK